MKDQWVDTMMKSVTLTDTKHSEKDLRAKLSKIFDKKFTDHPAEIFNNYENFRADTTLGSMVDWMHTAKPLIAESGVFFYQKSQKRNVNVEIIKENMLDARTLHKAEMFQCLDRGDTFGAAVKDSQQANDKKAANSGYGAEAQSSSFLYNLHSAASVTACGRGQLSTACQCFDNLLSDAGRFLNMDEFFTWITNIQSESHTWQFVTLDYVSDVPDREKFVERFVRKFENVEDCDRKIIGQVFDKLSNELRIRVYYKANLLEFLLNNRPSRLYAKIAASGEDFIDPNKIPPTLMKHVNLLSDLVTEFVNYKHSVFRYEDRTRYMKRSTVIVMD